MEETHIKNKQAGINNYTVKKKDLKKKKKKKKKILKKKRKKEKNAGMQSSTCIGV